MRSKDLKPKGYNKQPWGTQNIHVSKTSVTTQAEGQFDRTHLTNKTSLKIKISSQLESRILARLHGQMQG